MLYLVEYQNLTIFHPGLPGLCRVGGGGRGGLKEVKARGRHNFEDWIVNAFFINQQLRKQYDKILFHSMVLGSLERGALSSPTPP